MLMENASAQSWRYVDIADDRVDFVLERVPDRLSVGHRTFSVQYCGEQDAFLCFRSEAASFSIPKFLARSRDSVPTRWNHGGYEYALQRVRNAQFLGQKMKVYVIESVGSKPTFQFFFSPSRGLVAIKLKAGSSQPLVVEASCGFGASRACR